MQIDEITVVIQDLVERLPIWADWRVCVFGNESSGESGGTFFYHNNSLCNGLKSTVAWADKIPIGLLLSKIPIIFNQ